VSSWVSSIGIRHRHRIRYPRAQGRALTADTFVALADGKLNAQKAFMTGQLKVKGNIMLATKLDGVLKASKGKL
jgi:cytoskeletal protein CcmA (bactofilin family)